MQETKFLTLSVFLGMEKGDDGPTSEFYYFPNYPVPKIADFGLARLTAYSDNDNHPRGFFRGTRQYYAPVRTRQSLIKRGTLIFDRKFELTGYHIGMDGSTGLLYGHPASPTVHESIPGSLNIGSPPQRMSGQSVW